MMKKVKITVMRKVSHDDLIKEYENPIQHPCDIRLNQVFVSVDVNKPDGLCESAWQSMYPFVLALASGGGDFYDGWMKNKNSAMVSCNDGFRPVSFLLERID